MMSASTAAPAATSFTIVLDSVVDWQGFVHAARWLCRDAVAPDSVRWCVAGAPSADLFDAGPSRRAMSLPDAPALRLPAAFVEAARSVFLHVDDARWPLLVRLVRCIAEDARAWADPLHPDRLQFDRFQREVRREIHKMHAFVRFRQVTDSSHVAWFEPLHHVVEAAAPFFARRFSTMRWAILSPRVSVAWDGHALGFGPGAQRSDLPPADAGEGLWLDYYRSIFNPARVKVAMMKKEMPVRFWKNLPEASLITPLLAEAATRQQRMMDIGGAARERRRGALPAAATAQARAGACADADTGRNADAVGTADPGPGLAAGGRVRPGLEDLRRQALRCRDCPVADAATQTVFGMGPAPASLMVVGEQPGDAEDLRGLPFQGPAGQLLRAAFAELGWDADAVYLTNAVKHFHHELRGKRRMHKTPGQQEAQACLRWLDAEIAAVAPRAIVALGATAARSLLGRDVGVLANEGRWFTRADGIEVLVCLHPAAILRADASRRPVLRARWLQTLSLATAALAPSLQTPVTQTPVLQTPPQSQAEPMK